MPLEGVIASDAWKAHDRVTEHMRSLANELGGERGAVRALDVGSGPYGAGRVNMQCALHDTKGTLLLHDPGTAPERRPGTKVRVIDDARLAALGADDVDWVNFSYVLSHAGDVRRATALVMEMTGRFPNAIVTVTDYTLLGRGTPEALAVLTQSEAERRERERVGNDESYVAMHARYSRYLLERMLTNVAFMKLTRSEHVDEAKAKTFVAARPL
jgi:hypothetical protein